jgi:hypothetical protein
MFGADRPEEIFKADVENYVENPNPYLLIVFRIIV